MFIRIAIGAVALLAVFLGYVATRPGHFNYERSGVINAPAAKVFPYISQLKMGGQWSPYEKRDPNMKKSITGPDGQAGAAMDFDGNRDVGSGRIEIVKVVPNESVELRLLMTSPMSADNQILYRLTPEGAGTRFSWSMSGDGGFLGKLMSVLINCEKMIGGDMDEGIRNLKTLVESQR